VETLLRLLQEHPFLQGMKDEHLQVLVGCATNVRFEPGDFLVREGEEAKRWFLVREGQVQLETHIPGHGPAPVATLGDNDVIGWSWIVAPYLWHFDARAVQQTRAVALDGVCLRQKCDTDHDLGYELMKRFLRVVQQRLYWARLQLVDMYKAPGARR
jgi:CRP-like cAMP-binding protein